MNERQAQTKLNLTLIIPPISQGRTTLFINIIYFQLNSARIKLLSEQKQAKLQNHLVSSMSWLKILQYQQSTISTSQHWKDLASMMKSNFYSNIKRKFILGNIEIQMHMSQFKKKNYNFFYNILKIQMQNEQRDSLNYQIVSNQTFQKEWCYAIAFNKQSTIMVAGCENKIKVFEFLNGQLKEIELLDGHSNRISTLLFMRLSNQFISGSWDFQIRIWGINNKNQWNCKQLFKDAHTHRVNQVIVNKNEDLIISCSYDYNIKFWIMKNEWVCQQTLIAKTQILWSICLNELENQLIACGFYPQILIYFQNCEGRWQKMQIIQVKIYGQRLSFIENNLITFQSHYSISQQSMDVFALNAKSKLFEKSSQVQEENSGYCFQYFPQIYNKTKSILVNKNGFRLNLMRKKNNDDLLIEQSIMYDHQQLFGSMTEDGEYLVTWDYANRLFQIRQQQ